MPTAQKSKPAAKAAAPVAGKPPKEGDHVFLVDGSGYIFRAYHALPPINRKSDGLQLNAVFGFCNMLWNLLRDMKPEEQPTHLAVVFDKSEKTFRTEMYPDYKAHRPDPPDDLRPQFKYVREAVQAGAIGASTTRTILHRAKDGELAAGTTAAAEELIAIGEAAGNAFEHATADRGDGQEPVQITVTVRAAPATV